MENLKQFMDKNKLSQVEESNLDNIVLAEVGYKKFPSSRLFMKLAVTIVIVILLGLGVFILPLEQQEKVVKPVTALEVLQKTNMSLLELLEQPGILHYTYKITAENEFEDYDTFDVEAFVSNKDNKYLIKHKLLRSDYPSPEELIPGYTYTDFPPQEFATFSDGLNEYTYSYGSTTNWRILNPEQISIEHSSHLKSLIKFYDYLIKGNSDLYKMREVKFENRDAYLIIFQYPGMTLSKDGQGDTRVLESIYEANILLDKYTYLPISNETRNISGQVNDSVIEKYESFENLSNEDYDTVFNFDDYLNQLGSLEETEVEALTLEKLGTGRFELRNPGEDILSPVFVIGDRELIIEGSLLFDKISRKPTIIGKFLLGKELEVTGYIIKSEFGEILWIKNLDFLKLELVTPTPPVSPTITTLLPTATVEPTVPTQNSFSGIVYDSEYGGNLENAIQFAGVVPDGVIFTNKNGIESKYILLESDDMSFRIDEWYEVGFNYSSTQPTEFDSKNLGKLLIHEYSDKSYYYFSNINSYKTIGCKDYAGNTILSPCSNITYQHSDAGETRYINMYCEIKTNPEKAINTCKEIVNNLSIVK